MNKINKYLLMGTVALTGMAGFSACSSENNEPNPNPGESNGVVKTQFAINIPKAAGNTRQAGTTVQEGNEWEFRGMQNITLKSFATPTVTGTSTTTGKIVGIDDIDANENKNVEGTQDYKVYSDVKIPVGTSSFLLYAQAGVKSDLSNKSKNGSLNASNLDYTNGGTANSATFSLEKIVKNTTEITGPQTKLLAVLNGLAGLESWKKASDKDDPTYNGTLSDLRAAFIKQKAGSANAINLTICDLYNIVKYYTDGAGKEITDKIKEYFDDDEEGGFTYNNKFDVKDYNYPLEQGLPEGAAVLTYNTVTDQFSYGTKLGSTSTSGNNVLVNSITYPASLWYFDNTNLYATADGSFKDWPSSVSDWKTAGKFANWSSTVDVNSRVIALKDPVNYANALLVTKVTLNATESIKDSKDEDVTPNIMATAILVGGQPEKANWEFLPEGSEFNNTVYDAGFNGEDNSGVVPTYPSYTGANYTLLLDNGVFGADGKRAAKDQQGVVNVAVEFVNKGETFYGVDGGKILKDQKFYLIAKLDPKATTGLTGQDDENVKSVFMRDYKTTLNLTVKSLKNAYNTIPDIRSDKLQLGLAVDLTWQKGLQFDVSFD